MEEGEARWGDAARCAALLAVDPHGLGGVWLRAGAGPVRDHWQHTLRGLLPAGTPLRRMPGHINDDRLLGGLDLTATLSLGRPVVQRGLLAQTHGGIVIVPMAERLGAGTAARLAAALDSGSVAFERDGLSGRWDARLGLVACDEGSADDAPLAATLVDRLAFRVDLHAVSLRELSDSDVDAAAIARARALLPQVRLADELLQALCSAALQLGVDSARAGVFALRAARAAAALAGRDVVRHDDAVLAARLVLAPRATRLPPAPEQPTARENAAAPEPRRDQTLPADEPPDNDHPSSTRALEDRLVEACIAALPAGLLTALQAQPVGHRPGRVGALNAAPRGGRPVGVRRGEPRGGARLNLIETLRAAAPWQRLRRSAPGVTARPIHVHGDDLRVHRLQQRAGTATLFVLDASGSSALHRLAEAKGAINLLLADCYVRRDEVAVIAFRGKGAELLLPPTRSLVRARRSLAALHGGGGTPLAAGLEAVLRLAAQVRRDGTTPVIVLLTDGRANVARDGETGRVRAQADAMAMARQLRAARLTALVVDTSPQPAAAALHLAQAMAATYRALPHAGARALSAAVHALPRRSG